MLVVHIIETYKFNSIIISNSLIIITFNLKIKRKNSDKMMAEILKELSNKLIISQDNESISYVVCDKNINHKSFLAMKYLRTVQNITFIWILNNK